MQLKLLKRRLDNSPELKNKYTQTITSDLDKGYIVKVDKKDCFKVDCPRKWYLPHYPVFQRHKPGNVRRVPIGAGKSA